MSLYPKYPSCFSFYGLAYLYVKRIASAAALQDVVFYIIGQGQREINENITRDS